MLKCGSGGRMKRGLVSVAHPIEKEELRQLSRKCANCSKWLVLLVLTALSTDFSTTISTAFVEMVGSV
jgi:hypothetical protein